MKRKEIRGNWEKEISGNREKEIKGNRPPHSTLQLVKHEVLTMKTGILAHHTWRETDSDDLDCLTKVSLVSLTYRRRWQQGACYNIVVWHVEREPGSTKQ